MAQGQVVVVGGGFAGFWAALAARRVAGERADVTLVSQSPVLEMRPRLYEAHPELLGLDLRPLLRAVKVTLAVDRASGIDIEGRAILMASGQRVPYQRAVVATGSQLRRPRIHGVRRAYSIDTQAEAIRFDARLAELARTICRPIVAIVGAGFTGIELALELRDRLAAHGGQSVADRMRVLLIDRADEVGHDIGPGPRPLIKSALRAARVDCYLGATVTHIGAHELRLGGGRSLPADAVVLATGLAAAPFAAAVPGDRDELGRVFVDHSLRAPAAPDIFVAGDAAAAQTGDGHLALQSCQHALQLGRYAGENAARDLLGLPTLTYAQFDYDTCLDLGRSGAVFTLGWEREVAEAGGEAKARKHRINRTVIYPPAPASAAELLAFSSVELHNQVRRRAPDARTDIGHLGGRSSTDLRSNRLANPHPLRRSDSVN
jgi:NADH dehydrogenase